MADSLRIAYKLGVRLRSLPFLTMVLWEEEKMSAVAEGGEYLGLNLAVDALPSRIVKELNEWRSE